MKKPDWFKFYPEKWRSSRTVRRMSLAARAVYFDLLCEAWHQVPPGTVPNDDAALAELADVKPSVWAKVGDEVRRAFVVGEDGRLHQPFMVEVIAPAGYGKSEKNRAAAAARWGPKPDADAMHVHSERNASENGVQCHQEERESKSKNLRTTREAGSLETAPFEPATYEVPLWWPPAKVKLDAWSARDRKGRTMLAHQNEPQTVQDTLERSLGGADPVPHGGALQPAVNLIPQAVHVLMDKGVPFKNVEFACGCIKREIDQWREGNAAPGAGAGKRPGAFGAAQRRSDRAAGEFAEPTSLPIVGDEPGTGNAAVRAGGAAHET